MGEVPQKFEDVLKGGDQPERGPGIAGNLDGRSPAQNRGSELLDAATNKAEKMGVLGTSLDLHGRQDAIDRDVLDRITKSLDRAEVRAIVDNLTECLDSFDGHFPDKSPQTLSIRSKITDLFGNSKKCGDYYNLACEVSLFISGNGGNTEEAQKPFVYTEGGTVKTDLAILLVDSAISTPVQVEARDRAVAALESAKTEQQAVEALVAWRT